MKNLPDAGDITVYTTKTLSLWRLYSRGGDILIQTDIYHQVDKYYEGRWIRVRVWRLKELMQAKLSTNTRRHYDFPNQGWKERPDPWLSRGEAETKTLHTWMRASEEKNDHSRQLVTMYVENDGIKYFLMALGSRVLIKATDTGRGERSIVEVTVTMTRRPGLGNCGTASLPRCPEWWHKGGYLTAAWLSVFISLRYVETTPP